MNKTSHNSNENNIHVCIMIPGLGLSSNVFKKLNIPFDHCIPLDWIPPMIDEDLSSYCNRLLAPFSLKKYASITIIGHSFGGIIAQKIAQNYSVKRLI